MDRKAARHAQLTLDLLGLRIGTATDTNSRPKPFGGLVHWTIAVGDAKLEARDADHQKNLSDFLKDNPDLLHALTTRLSAGIPAAISCPRASDAACTPDRHGDR